MKRLLFAIIAITFLLSSCAKNTDPNTTVSFEDKTESVQIEPAPESESSPQPLNITPVSGDFTVGVYIDPEQSNTVESEAFVASYDDYQVATNVNITILEYSSVADFLKGAQNGEYDLADINSSELIQVFANRHLLADLEGILWDYLNDPEHYFTNILEAGRIDGSLQIAIPYFDLLGIRILSDACAGLEDKVMSFEDLSNLYYSLDVSSRSSLLLFLLDFAPASVDLSVIESGFNEKHIRNLEQAVLLDANMREDFQKNSGDGATVQEPSFLTSYSYTRIYETASTHSVLPYPGNDALSLSAKYLGLIANSDHISEAAAYLQWVFSEEGQRAHEGQPIGNTGSYPSSYWVHKASTEYVIRRQLMGTDFPIETAYAQTQSEIEKVTHFSYSGPSIRELQNVITARLHGSNAVTETPDAYSSFVRHAIEQELISNAEAKEVSDFDDWGEFCAKALELYYKFVGYIVQPS
ncbi:MAG: hypothetical protein IJF34_03995 [Clostridia bacterium]|nr:hypothetical protein [Clostridia bacterium]